MFNEHYFQRLLKILLISILISPALPVEAQVYLSEGFELGARPEGWTEEYTYGKEPWRYRNGGHSPNDNNWLVPPEQEDITRNPPSAYEGTYNAIFFKQGDNNERTKLITPPMNLLGGASIQLSFYLCQIPWTFEGSTDWDVLRVYYKVSESAPWVLLHKYLDPVYEWAPQILTLPNPSSTYYVAFEGHTRWGYGTCIDKISIESIGLEPLWIKDIDFQQPFTSQVPSGSPDVPLMRIDFTVYGNSGSAILQNIIFTSLNTSDNDIQPGGVKLYSTITQTFSKETPVGSPGSFVSGIASFTNLNHSLPPGHSYLWLAVDIKNDVAYGNTLDVKIAPNSILANSTLYPSSEKSPAGSRVIYSSQYFEGFEATHNWSLTGEFEVNSPNGSGGLPGNPDPSSAFRGIKILGTDLTGLGAHPNNYEPDLSDALSYRATSPTLDLFYYKNLNLFFQRYLNIEVWDSAYIQVSIDNGNTWNNIWNNHNSWISDFQWAQQRIEIPDEYARTHQLQIRFQLGPTDGEDNYSGWNIDDVYLTGEFIIRDVGVSEWIYPLSGSGHSSADSVTVRISNFGGAEITEPVPVTYSFDGGLTWVVNNMTRNIPVGGSVVFTFPTKADLSVPGLKPSVLAKTLLPNDQYTGNDQLSTQIYIIPTYKPPYSDNFETNDGFWRSVGNEIWEYGTPAGSVIDSASSGMKSWVTGLNRTYGEIITRRNRIIFEDDFEYDLGWSYSGEFERNIPDYAFLPYFAWSGYYCIGTDLSGKGTNLFSYENGISPASAYTATTPSFDVRNYSNLTASFYAWITIQQGDSLEFEVSKDNGVTWYTIWKNTSGAISDEDFMYRQFTIPESLGNSEKFRLRFSLFYTSASGSVAQGWSIDDFQLTGDLVNVNEGSLTSPSYDLSGLTNPVFESKLWIETEQSADGATLLYSLDDGINWTPVTNTSAFDTYWNWYTGKPVSALGLNGWSGHSNGWLTTRHLLPFELINKKNVQFRYKFMADKVNNEFDGIAIDDIKITEAPHDLGVLAILSPVTACELSANQKFTLRLKNYGIRNLSAGDSIRIGYHIERSGLIQEDEETIYLTQAFTAGTTRDFNLTKEFDFSIGGEYNTRVFTLEDDPFYYYPVSNDTLYQLIRVNKPVVDLGPDISTVRPDTVILRAFSGVAGYDYRWQDNSKDSVYHVSTQGTYYVRVSNDIGCIASDTVHVTELIADVGVSQLITPASACELGNNVPVWITLKNFGTDTVEVNDSIFIYRKINSGLLADTLIVSKPIAPDSTIDYLYSRNYNFSAPGIYEMKLYTRYRDDYRKDNDTLIYTLEVYGYPAVELGDDVTLMAPEYVLTAPAGYQSYRWQDGSTLGSFTVEQAGPGFYYVTVSDDHQCTASDSVRVTLNMTDVELDRILSPETSCGLSESITVSVRIKNSGNQLITSGQTINLGYFVDQGSPYGEPLILTKDFLPGDSIDFTFSQQTSVMTGNWYDFTVFVSFAADMKLKNDTITMPVGVFKTPVVDLGEDYKVVTALQYILDAGPGFVSYLWHDGSTGQTYTIKTPGINKCSVTVTDLNGCPGYDEISVMLAVPDIGVVEILNPKTSCILGTAEKVKIAVQNLSNWDIDKSESIAVSYSLNGRPPVTENIVLDANFENGTVIYHTFARTEDLSALGNYVINAATIYASDLIPSNNSLNVNFSVLGSPVVDIGGGRDTVLTYNPVVLSATPGYASYKWQDGSTGTTFGINSPGAAMYSVLVTGINGCSTRDSVFVAYDAPDIGISRIVSPVNSCKPDQYSSVSFEVVNNGFYRIPGNETINVTCTINNGSPVTEAFNPGSTLYPGQSRIMSFITPYDFSEPGNYQISLTLSHTPDNNTLNNSLSSSVTIWELPEIEIGGGKDTIKTYTLPITLDAGTGFASYQWQDNSVRSTLNVTQWNLYWVRVTDENGCSAADSVYVYSPFHVEELQAFPGEVKIYPNPVQDILHVKVDLEVARNIRIELFDLNGIPVYREEYKEIQSAGIEIFVNGFTPGEYFLRITVDKISGTYKVIVK